MRDFSRLLKPNWTASDIKAYFDLSMNKAIDIFNSVKEEKGYIYPEMHLDSRGTVSADDVIAAMGGKNRLEEVQIYNTYSNINRLFLPIDFVKGENNNGI